jgi:hypothetical protein
MPLPKVTPFPKPPYNEEEDRKKKAKAEEEARRNATPTTAAAFNKRLRDELADKKNKNKKS